MASDYFGPSVAFSYATRDVARKPGLSPTTTARMGSQIYGRPAAFCSACLRVLCASSFRHRGGMAGGQLQSRTQAGDGEDFPPRLFPGFYYSHITHERPPASCPNVRLSPGHDILADGPRYGDAAHARSRVLVPLSRNPRRIELRAHTRDVSGNVLALVISGYFNLRIRPPLVRDPCRPFDQGGV